ncbi:DUF4304 domain-containing protein [Xanthomonas campestris pv. esculenti]|nr:DUF4304 domain-containing protein [Xanthomonas campestris pv. esculenti]
MDSKIVNREIKRAIWPALKEAGFTRFTQRVAWRHHQDSIDVLDFQSFNSYNAEILGVTTFSFCVNLGKYLLYVPPQWEVKVKDGIQFPRESECLFRGRLHPNVSAAASDKTIWSIDNAGKNLPWCIQDVLSHVPTALDWLLRLEDRAEVLRILMEQDEDMQHLWGFGRNPSPIRSYFAGYVSLALDNRELAYSKLQEAVDSKCFTRLFTSVGGAVNRAV